MMNEYNDIPINWPDDDRFGFCHIAESIAEAIIGIKDPEGSVISIYGPWGTGKSSLVNLVKHFIKFESKNNEIKIVDLNFWWFKGEEAIAIEFFRKLRYATGINEKQFAKLGSQVLCGLGPLVGSAFNLFLPGSGNTVSTIIEYIENQIEESNTVEYLHEKISIELRKSKKKFLIVIDDIDRLSPEEALLVFRLVKSVGRLPNLIYLMAYDRENTEKAVTKRYPSEGPHYLEKIVQAGFDVPKIQQPIMEKILGDILERIWGKGTQPQNKRYNQIMNDVVFPKIKSYRDVLRIKNMLEVTWKPVAGMVDPLDFLTIELIRLKLPKLYYIIKSSKEYLTDSGIPLLQSHSDRKELAKYCDSVFLSDLQGKEKIYVKTILMHLFPSLVLVWKNIEDKDKERNTTMCRACSGEHFDTYFRFLP